MSFSLLIQSERWKRAGLASRITVLSLLLTVSVMLPILGMSYAALHSLLAGKIEADLYASATTTRLGFEARLAAAVDKITSASRQTIFSNALADSAERKQYILPILRELCDTIPFVDTLALADFRGRPLERGCRDVRAWTNEQTDSMQRSIDDGRRIITVVGPETALRMNLAAPIVYLPTASFEGGLTAELDLEAMFRSVAKGIDSPYAFRLRHLAANESGQASTLYDALSHVAPLSMIDGDVLPLAVEVSIDRQLAYRPLYWLLIGFLAMGAGVLALVAWQSRRLARIIAEPLAELERTAARVATGDLEAIPVPSAPDDGDSFQVLTTSVHRMIAALRDTQQRLTATVELRTTEAEHAEQERVLKEHALASTDSGILILRWNGNRQYVHYANPAFLSITGLTSSQAQGAPWPCGVFPDSVGGLIEAGTAGSEPISFTHRRVDGKSVYIELSVSRVAEDASLPHLHTIVVVNDVTRRVHTLRAHKARLESLREIVFELDCDLRYVFLNRSWERITGHPVETTLRQNLRTSIHVDDLLQHQPQLVALGHGTVQAYEAELRIHCLDGSIRWLWIDIATMRDDSGQVTGYSGTMTDVTEQHEANVAIALRDRALQSVTNGIVITDLEQRDNPIIYVNPAFERITGYASDDVIGKNCRLLSKHDRNQPEVSMLRNAVAARKPCTVTLRNCRKDGSEFWNQISISPLNNPLTGAATHFVGVQTDITERKRSDDLLLEWLSRLDAVFTLGPDPVVCFDDQGRLSYANVAAERVFSTTMGTLTGMSLADFGAHLTGMLDRTCGSLRLPHVLPQEDQAPSMWDDDAQDCLIHLAHPKPCTLHQTYRYCGASSSSLVLYYRDVTREIELDRMKSEFLSTAAHELRTPMASIMGFSELLMLRKYDEDKTRELLGTINRQAQRLTNLLTDLLDLARIEARRAEGFHFETLPLQQAIDEAVHAFLVPDDTHRLVLDLPASLPPLRMDRAKIQQAMLNLLSNACKFSPDGGDVEVTVRAEHPEGLAFIGISVRDHGIGMDATECSRAFERFYRSDRSGHIPGTGLGLALVHEIMRIHGGTVTLESEVDSGTCVTLWFPFDRATDARTRSEITVPQTP